MKKIERRAIMCLLLAVVLLAGLCVFVYRDVHDGAKWASYQGNRDVYAEGKLAKGAVFDRNGELLLRNTADGIEYNESSSVRAGCMHITGDRDNNIATGSNRVFIDKLIGYDFVNGIYALNNTGQDLFLTVDGGLCAEAYEAMDGRRGTVGVYNYKTGEILCMVSGPTFDPTDPPYEVEEGTYINHFTSSTFAPGSTFKLVTSAASIENFGGAFSYAVDCTGSISYGDDAKVTCEEAHGEVMLEEALEVSCNCYFGELSQELGGDLIGKYAKKGHLTEGYDINGIETKAGSFDFDVRGPGLAWTGIGQYKDMVNPCAMMVYAGSIANGGEGIYPYILDPRTLVGKQVSRFTTKSQKMMEPETASNLKNMMANNVESHYGGEDNFPGLRLCAKTGTAEVAGQDSPNSWFVGFLDDDAHPYAFVVLIEEGGYGVDAAGSVANQVLQRAVGND